MFTELASVAFGFLKEEFGFTPRPINAREIQFERNDSFVNLSHSRLDEVSLRVGSLRKGSNQSFDAGTLIALSDSARRNSITDQIASKPAQIEEALSQCAQLLRTHGIRVLEGDPKVFDEMQEIAESHWNTKKNAQIRHRAERAFAAKDFEEALKHYQILGDYRRPLDTKRMEIAERRSIT